MQFREDKQTRRDRLNSLLKCSILRTAKTRSDRDFEMSLEEINYNINHCLELAPSFPKMYNITMF